MKKLYLIPLIVFFMMACRLQTYRATRPDIIVLDTLTPTSTPVPTPTPYAKGVDQKPLEFGKGYVNIRVEPPGTPTKTSIYNCEEKELEEWYEFEGDLTVIFVLDKRDQAYDVTLDDGLILVAGETLAQCESVEFYTYTSSDKPYEQWSIKILNRKGKILFKIETY